MSIQHDDEWPEDDSARIGSLCSGYGGLDDGVIRAFGGSVAWHIEHDEAPSRILAHHWPDVPNHGDVKHTDWASVEPVDILTAGYPCQPFSHAGKRKGSDDPRHLWPHVARAIGALRPRLVVLENVRGHVSLGLDAVVGDLSSLGYDARWHVVRAADAGAPHGRSRIFIVATPHAERADGRAATWDGGATGELLVAVDRGAAVAADAEGIGRREGWAESARLVGGSDAAECCDPTAADADDAGRVEHGWAVAVAAEHGSAERGVEWGQYAPAIRRWELVLGRPAPDPTEPGRNGRPRLSPVFVEWMQGLDPGHVTDPAIGLTRNQQLKALGNGVVPQQAALALRLLVGAA